MSTKLHHGYRLAPGADPFAFIDVARAALDPVRDQLDAREVTARALRLIDDAVYAGTTIPDRPLAVAYSEYLGEQRQMNPDVRGQDPHRFGLALRPDGQTGRIGVLIYTDHSDLVHAWEALEQVEPYPYWNNSDRPDDANDAEWDARRTFWDRLLPTGVAAAHGMLHWDLRAGFDDTWLHQLTAEYEGGTHPLIGAALNNLEDRASRLARAAILRGVHTSNLSDMIHLVDALHAEGTPEAVLTAARALIIPVTCSTLVGAAPMTVMVDINRRRARLDAAVADASAALIR